MKRLASQLLSLTSLLLASCALAARPEATHACAGAPTEATRLTPDASVAPLVFLSTQFTPPREIEQFRRLLRNAPVEAKFHSLDTETFHNRMDALQRDGKVRMSLVGGQHGDLAPFAQKDYLEDLASLLHRLSDRKFPGWHEELSRLGTPDRNYYVPWTKATYILAINKKALQYKPERVSIDALTYRELKEWGADIQKATGQPKLGFPAGPGGLLHRLFQGYLYPSHTGSSVVEFRSAAAVEMWREFAEIWKVTNPESTTYDSMQEPLKSEDVWIAWDHTARLMAVVKQRPDDFLLVPAPSGPQGRGFMVVPSGLAVPKGAPDRQGAEQEIDYLTGSEQQLTTFCELGFVPASGAIQLATLPTGLKNLLEAVTRQEEASDGLLALPPIGLGDKQDNFNRVYQNTFESIVLNNQGIEHVLESNMQVLQAIIDAAGAPCWPPDPPSIGPCKVK